MFAALSLRKTKNVCVYECVCVCFPAGGGGGGAGVRRGGALAGERNCFRMHFNLNYWAIQ